MLFSPAVGPLFSPAVVRSFGFFSSGSFICSSSPSLLSWAVLAFRRRCLRVHQSRPASAVHTPSSQCGALVHQGLAVVRRAVCPSTCWPTCSLRVVLCYPDPLAPLLFARLCRGRCLQSLVLRGMVVDSAVLRVVWLFCASAGTPRCWACASKVCTLRLSSDSALFGFPRSCTGLLWFFGFTSPSESGDQSEYGCDRGLAFPASASGLQSRRSSVRLSAAVAAAFGCVPRGQRALLDADMLELIDRSTCLVEPVSVGVLCSSRACAVPRSKHVQRRVRSLLANIPSARPCGRSFAPELLTPSCSCRLTATLRPPLQHAPPAAWLGCDWEVMACSWGWSDPPVSVLSCGRRHVLPDGPSVLRVLAARLWELWSSRSACSLSVPPFLHGFSELSPNEVASPSFAVTSARLPCLLAPLVIMLKISSTLLRSWRVLPFSTVSSCTVKQMLIIWTYIHCNSIWHVSLSRPIYLLVLPDTVHCIMAKSLAAIGDLIKTAATIRSTRIVRFMHEVCSCDADAVWKMHLHELIVNSADTKLHDCIDARRPLSECSRMLLRGEASDHCHHLESYEICQCLQSNTWTFTEQWVRLSVGFTRLWMELMCWLCQRLQLLEPCFRQREKEESMLSRRESISMVVCVEEDRLWQMTRDPRYASCFVSTVSPARRAAFTAPALLASLPFFFVMRACNKRCLELASAFQVGQSCRIPSSLQLETCQCAKHCANDFVDFGVLHCVHQCVLGTSRVALRLGCCVLLTEGCDQRDVLQHLLSALLLLLTVVAGAASSDCSIEGVLLSSSSDDVLSGGNLLNCCAADCLGVWVSGWLVPGSWSWTLAPLPCTGCACSCSVLGSWSYLGHPQPPQLNWARGVLWVSTGTHPCGSPSRQDDGETRAPALHTLDDVLRLSRRCGL